MDRKEIQKQRMMRYFTDAAKEIILEEGIKGLSARKVGERAGYSYATIYNYFSDFNSLISYCVFDFLEDCYKYMISFRDDNKNCIEQIEEYSLAYFKYFAENPDLFQLIFVEDLGKAPEELMKNNMYPSVSLLLKEGVVSCAKEGYIRKEDVEALAEIIGASIHGKLLFFIKGRSMEKLDKMLDCIKKEIKFLFKGKG